jgi:hypothetical protein
MFAHETIEEIARTADAMELERAALLAVAEVESGGVAFTLVDGMRKPVIRFEGHYFDRRLGGARRDRARSEGLASPTAGKIANPRRQAERWAMLLRARSIDAKAADESVSWGIGQVMGAHWAWLGYGSVADLVAEACDGVAGQTRLMLRYIDKAGLAAALRRHDWHAFARGYNGPAYARNAYHSKMAEAYARHARNPLAAPAKPGGSTSVAASVAEPRPASNAIPIDPGGRPPNPLRRLLGWLAGGGRGS